MLQELAKKLDRRLPGGLLVGMLDSGKESALSAAEQKIKSNLDLWKEQLTGYELGRVARSEYHALFAKIHPVLKQDVSSYGGRFKQYFQQRFDMLVKIDKMADMYF